MMLSFLNGNTSKRNKICGICSEKLTNITSSPDNCKDLFHYKCLRKYTDDKLDKNKLVICPEKNCNKFFTRIATKLINSINIIYQNVVLSNEDNQCCICFSKFKIPIASSDSCSHTFCYDCIKQWCTFKHECPMDRKPIKLLLVSDFPGGHILDRIEPPAIVQDLNSDLENDELINTTCEICNTGQDEDRLLLCDHCNKGYHMYCLSHPLSSIPEGDWFCDNCQAYAPIPIDTTVVPGRRMPRGLGRVVSSLQDRLARGEIQQNGAQRSNNATRINLAQRPRMNSQNLRSHSTVAEASTSSINRNSTSNRNSVSTRVEDSARARASRLRINNDIPGVSSVTAPVTRRVTRTSNTGEILTSLNFDSTTKKRKNDNQSFSDDSEYSFKYTLNFETLKRTRVKVRHVSPDNSDSEDEYPHTDFSYIGTSSKPPTSFRRLRSSKSQVQEFIPKVDSRLGSNNEMVTKIPQRSNDSNVPQRKRTRKVLQGSLDSVNTSEDDFVYSPSQESFVHNRISNRRKKSPIAKPRKVFKEIIDVSDSESSSDVRTVKKSKLKSERESQLYKVSATRKKKLLTKSFLKKKSNKRSTKSLFRKMKAKKLVKKVYKYKIKKMSSKRSSKGTKSKKVDLKSQFKLSIAGRENNFLPFFDNDNGRDQKSVSSDSYSNKKTRSLNVNILSEIDKKQSDFRNMSLSTIERLSDGTVIFKDPEASTSYSEIKAKPSKVSEKLNTALNCKSNVSDKLIAKFNKDTISSYTNNIIPPSKKEKQYTQNYEEHSTNEDDGSVKNSFILKEFIPNQHKTKSVKFSEVNLRKEFNDKNVLSITSTPPFLKQKLPFKNLTINSSDKEITYGNNNIAVPQSANLNDDSFTLDIVDFDQIMDSIVSHQSTVDKLVTNYLDKDITDNMPLSKIPRLPETSFSYSEIKATPTKVTQSVFEEFDYNMTVSQSSNLNDVSFSLDMSNFDQIMEPAKIGTHQSTVQKLDTNYIDKDITDNMSLSKIPRLPETSFSFSEIKATPTKVTQSVFEECDYNVTVSQSSNPNDVSFIHNMSKFDQILEPAKIGTHQSTVQKLDTNSLEKDTKFTQDMEKNNSKVVMLPFDNLQNINIASSQEFSTLSSEEIINSSKKKTFNYISKALSGFYKERKINKEEFYLLKNKILEKIYKKDSSIPKENNVKCFVEKYIKYYLIKKNKTK